MRPPKVAIVHEWLTTYAGSERVLEQLIKLYPDADVFAVVDFLPDSERGFLQGRSVTTSFIQRLPFAKKHFRHYLPLMPLAIEQFELGDYDLILSSNHAVAKGVLTGPDQVHVSYVHSPIRYAWDLQGQYLRESGLRSGLKSWIVRASLHYMRLWDTRTASGVDSFIANSSFIQRRIRKAYGRDSRVIFPPVDVAGFSGEADKGDFFLAAGRMVPYKKMPLIVEAFARMPQHRLVVIGEGPDFERCKALATPNVTLLGYQRFDVLRDHMLRARGFVFAGEEDFGIMLVEAQAAGTPLIAYGNGGARDIVRPVGAGAAPTGLFFEEQTVGSIVDAVGRFVACEAAMTPLACKNNARGFSEERFRAEIAALVEEELAAFNGRVACAAPGIEKTGPVRAGIVEAAMLPRQQQLATAAPPRLQTEPVTVQELS
ncbi:glycosyltransferase family 4 protein [Telluria mixta]|uniref:Glycosyltransferase family 4 protein n=1 Tax=Telluria mixta TaxID=34071 RepID=A0ABT2BRJ2_9BURK|nr:glycosyltransferase family 4 protein [Telluria mixta]MCS0627733.1 glycosyltransferase family 4 protein [Telluria mixta]WEM99394.1 glycosyltransferase family 4 protein [Telluria mixta]